MIPDLTSCRTSGDSVCLWSISVFNSCGKQGNNDTTNRLVYKQNASFGVHRLTDLYQQFQLEVVVPSSLWGLLWVWFSRAYPDCPVSGFHGPNILDSGFTGKRWNHGRTTGRNTPLAPKGLKVAISPFFEAILAPFSWNGAKMHKEDANDIFTY